jgi:hypothetical protein
VSGRGQELAVPRHALRRGPAPLRRELLGLRAAVPGAARPAARHVARPGPARHRGRPRRARPHLALHRRHDDRARRLPPAPLGRARAPSPATAAAARCAAAPSTAPPTTFSTEPPTGARAVVTWRVPTGDPERYLGVRERLLEEGYRRVLVDGATRDLDEVPPSEAVRIGGLDVIVDRLVAAAVERSRVAEALATAMTRGACAPRCASSTRGASPCASPAGSTARTATGATPSRRPGSSRSRRRSGACGECRGFGRVIDIDWDKVVPDPSLCSKRAPSSRGPPRSPSGSGSSCWSSARSSKVPVDTPWRDLPERSARILEGPKGFDGVRPWFQWLETKTYQMHVRVFLSRFRATSTCATCGRLAAAPGGAALPGVRALGHRGQRHARRRARRAPGRRCPIDEPTDRIVPRRSARASGTSTTWASATSRSTARRARSPGARCSAWRSPPRWAPRSRAR